jgi:hypothetical protein
MYVQCGRIEETLQCDYLIFLEDCLPRGARGQRTSSREPAPPLSLCILAQLTDARHTDAHVRCRIPLRSPREAHSGIAESQ